MSDDPSFNHGFSLPRVHGVLTWVGRDGNGLACRALEHLYSCARAVGHTNVTQLNIGGAWIRSFGPYGGVVFRFDGPTDLVRLLRRRYRATLPGELRAEGPATGPGLVIHRADQPYSAHGDLTGVHVWFRRDVTTQDATLLSHLHNLLSSVPGVDIAQGDQMVSGDRWLYSVRVFDLRRRGHGWLKAWVASALEHAGLAAGSDGAPPIVADDDDMGPHGDYADVLREMVSHAMLDPGRRRDRRYLYLVAHTLDRGGIFADLYHFLHTTPAGPGGPRVRRNVVRTSCRALGGEGLLLMAAELDPGDRVDERWLTHELRSHLEATFLQARARGEFPQTLQPLEPAFPGYWTATMEASSVSPWDFADKLEALPILPLTAIDRPRLLVDIFSAAEAAAGGRGRVNVYHYNGRPRADAWERGGDSAQRFLFTLGIAVAPGGPGREKLKDAIERALGTGGGAAPGTSPSVEPKPGAGQPAGR